MHGGVRQTYLSSYHSSPSLLLRDRNRKSSALRGSGGFQVPFPSVRFPVARMV